MTVKMFCEEYDACVEGAEWAFAKMGENADMAEVFPLLLDAPDKEWYRWTVFESELLTKEQVYQFTRWVALQVVHLIDNPEEDIAVIKHFLETGKERENTVKALNTTPLTSHAPAITSPASRVSRASVYAAMDAATLAAAVTDTSVPLWAAVNAANAAIHNALFAVQITALDAAQSGEQEKAWLAAKDSELDKHNRWRWDHCGNICEETKNGN
jgi:hypothetical protein